MTYRIETPRLYLRPLTKKDVSQRYVFWLNDKETNQYLVDVSRSNHDERSVKDFIEQVNKNENEFLFGIFLKDTDKHIGNIKIGPIRAYHKVAELGFLVGEKSEWGKGYGSEAIKAACKYAFESLGVRKVSAGLYLSNVACAKALEKAGFVKEGHRLRHYLMNDKEEDILEYGYLKPSNGP